MARAYARGISRDIIKRQCKFYPNGPRGSFQISGDYKDNLAPGVAHIDVKVGRPGFGVVYARLTSGRYVRWGSVRRSNGERACWFGSGVRVCAL